MLLNTSCPRPAPSARAHPSRTPRRRARHEVGRRMLMQLCSVRSCGVCRPRPSRKVGGRAHDGHAQVRPDAHGDHVLCHLLAEADAGVVALGHDVGQAVVDDSSTLMSGYSGRNLARAGHRIVSAACSPVVIRIVPAGFSRSSLSAASSASISSNRGPQSGAGARPPPSAQRCAWCGSAAEARAAPRACGWCG